MKQKLRYVEVRGVRYIRMDDVVELLRELGSTKETDVRRRLDKAASNLGEYAQAR